LHFSLKQAYDSIYGNLEMDFAPILFDSAELGYLLSVFENDDLLVELKVGRPGQEYTPIDHLSAGQWCTAVFPILLKLGQGALVIDQPEDNLDNRHIATSIAPALLTDKKSRQMLLTSHNANLVVLSDAESIMLFESDGTRGWLREQGFLATKWSPITKHVVDVLDGGDKALERRALKYGLK
jgi:energy-coupling factor transporter ATP-binding protein EcfA2